MFFAHDSGSQLGTSSLVSTGVTHVAAVTCWCHRAKIVQNGLIPWLAFGAGFWLGFSLSVWSLILKEAGPASSPNSVRAAKGHEWKL